MAEIVNLRRARKARERAQEEATAAENRLRFGRTKTERKTEKAKEELRAKRLDQHRREPGRDDEAGR